MQKPSFKTNRHGRVVLLMTLAIVFQWGIPGRGLAQEKDQDPVESIEIIPLDPASEVTKTLSAQEPILQVPCFDVRYAEQNPGHPCIDDIYLIDLVLGQAEGCYTAPQADAPPLTLRLSDLPDLGMQSFRFSALRSINEQIVAFLNEKGLVGVVVTPDPVDLGYDGADLRSSPTQPLHLVIHTAVAKRIRTLATRYRFPGEERMNLDAHQRIKEYSPVRPTNPLNPDGSDLLRKDLLDDYLFRLNRHPGRRVDVAVTPGDQGDDVFLDYLVTEKKPWIGYLQATNNGTENTKTWRWRLGFVHNQFSDNDDILSLDYVTTDFSSPESRGALLSYEAPFFKSDTTRWSSFITLGEFESSDVSRRDEDFTGKTTKIGAELYINAYQRRDFFADFLTGLRMESLEVNNKAVQLKGKEQLIFPYLGCRFERRNERAGTQGRVTLEWSDTTLTDPDQIELTELGRLGPSKHWYALKWDMSHAFFLEPWLDSEAWEDVTTPESSTLAHEIMAAVRGQYTFGKRVIPQHEGLAGGAYSVRGYPTAIASGDSMITATLEYRYHLPRSFEIEPDPGRTPLFGDSFRFAPQQVYGRPDWDLIFRAFIDAGRTNFADRLVIEKNESLLGSGLGVELAWKDNISLRADWGVAMRTVKKHTQDEVETGDSEVHLSFTFLF
ncbi:MAG: hypothetical protein KJ645_00375 [Planctomycetes bacterium]|nr:hypothetical protein [Planctomycetota bacterium]